MSNAIARSDNQWTNLGKLNDHALVAKTIIMLQDNNAEAWRLMFRRSIVENIVIKPQGTEINTCNIISIITRKFVAYSTISSKIERN